MKCDIDLKTAVRHMVMNISKSFIVAWYDNISQTNHDFVASCEVLIEDAIMTFADLCSTRLDKYKVAQLITTLIHDHVLSQNSKDRLQSIENQIDNHEYDICQNSVIRLFGLLSNEDLRRVIFTPLPPAQDLKGRFKFPRQRYAQDFGESSFSGESATTSALYTLVIAMLTEASFMPIIDTISSPKWLYAVIIWLCQKEKRERSESKAKDGNPEPTNSKASTPGSSENMNDNKFAYPRDACGSKTYDIEEGSDLISSSINFNNPVCDSLKRPIDNIDIYATEEVKSDNSCYVQYCISYDGLYNRHPSSSSNILIESPDVPVIDKRSGHYTRTLDSSEPRASITSIASCRKTYRKRMTIKRRFREFVLLQLRLEENPKIRPYMKNIPKPTKLKAATQNIFSLPGITNIKLDQSTIKLRQRFLERFLTAINNSPFIANSYEFKEFFDYSFNPSPSSAPRNKSFILQVNLNKVFVDSVRSAFSLLRSSLPGEDSRLRSEIEHDPDAWLIKLQQSTMKLHVQTRTSHSKMALERYIDSKLLSMSESPLRHGKSSSLGRYNERAGSVQLGHSRGGSLKANMVKSYSMNSVDSSPTPLSGSSSNSHNVGDSSKSSSTESIYFDALHSFEEQTSFKQNSVQVCDNSPIASKFIEIMNYSFTGDSNCTNSSISYLAKFFLGKTIERHIARLIEVAFNRETAAFCIHKITGSIWGESDDPPLDLDHASYEDATRHLSELIEDDYGGPAFIPRSLLHSIIRSQTKFYLSQLSSEKRNKFVIYSFLVHLLDELEAAGRS